MLQMTEKISKYKILDVCQLPPYIEYTQFKKIREDHKKEKQDHGLDLDEISPDSKRLKMTEQHYLITPINLTGQGSSNFQSKASTIIYRFCKS